MKDALIKPDIVLVTKNIMVPLALPVPENKFFPAARIPRKKTTIVKARKSRLLSGRAIFQCPGLHNITSDKNAMLQTNVELRSSDYLACDYNSLIDWEDDLKKNYEVLYSKGLALSDAGFGDARSEGSGSLDYLSQNFPQSSRMFSSIKYGQGRNLERPNGKETRFGDLTQTRIDLGKEKNYEISTQGRDYNESFNHCGKDLVYGNALSGEIGIGGDKKQNCSKNRSSDEPGEMEMIFRGSRQIGIEFGEEKNYLPILTSGRDCDGGLNLCGKGHTLDRTELTRNKNKNCLSQLFSDRCKTLSLKNGEKDKIADGAEKKEILLEGSMQNELEFREENNNFGISTSGRDGNKSFDRCGKGSTLGAAVSGAIDAQGIKKQNGLSQSFPAHSMAVSPDTISNKSLLPNRKNSGKEEIDRKQITSDEPTQEEFRISDADNRWKSRDMNTTELRRCGSGATSLDCHKTFGREADKECEIKYSWEDLHNWVPPSAKKRIAKIDERLDLPVAKKHDCKITYSWQIIGTSAQTSYELISSLFPSPVEGEGKCAEAAVNYQCAGQGEGKCAKAASNYPCAVKYSWQIFGTGTQVSFRRDMEDSLPNDEDYWTGKIVRPRRRFVEGSKDGEGSKPGSLKIMYSEMTQTVIDESHQTELGDCRVKYSWQNLTKPYLEKIRRL